MPRPLVSRSRDEPGVFGEILPVSIPRVARASGRAANSARGLDTPARES